MEKDYKAYVRHILDSLTLIEKYTKDTSFEGFRTDSKTVDAVIRNFEIVGEASSKLPKEFREKYPRVPWKNMIGLRNVLIHQYFGVDVAAVWENIKQKVPELREKIQSVLEEE